MKRKKKILMIIFIIIAVILGIVLLKNPEMTKQLVVLVKQVILISPNPIY